jgi:outer membrane protein
MRRLNLALAPLALLLAGLTTGAQAVTLRELVDMAHGYDAALASAQTQVKAAAFKVEQTLALNRPGVNLSSGTANKPTLGWQATSGYGQNTDVLTLNGDVTVQAKMPLINKGNAVTQAQALRSLELAQADVRAAQQDLILRVSQAYFDILAAQDVIDTVAASKAAVAEQLAAAKRNFEVGTATITDTREAQARFDLVTAQEIAAQNDLQVKRVALDQLVGKPGISPSRLQTGAMLSQPVKGDAETWVREGEDKHPSLQKARLGLEVARLESDRARAAEAYTLDAVAATSYSVTHFSSSGTSNTRNAGVGLLFSMPLSTGGATQARIKETAALEDKARSDLDAARRSIGQATRQVYFGLQSVLAQVKALEAAESSSKLALEATQLGYKVGVRVNLDVLNAQTQVYNTQRDLSKARYDTLLNFLKLRQVSGQLQAEDLDSISALAQR